MRTFRRYVRREAGSRTCREDTNIVVDGPFFICLGNMLCMVDKRDLLSNVEKESAGVLPGVPIRYEGKLL